MRTARAWGEARACRPPASAGGGRPGVAGMAPVNPCVWHLGQKLGRSRQQAHAPLNWPSLLRQQPESRSSMARQGSSRASPLLPCPGWAPARGWPEGGAPCLVGHLPLPRQLPLPPLPRPPSLAARSPLAPRHCACRRCRPAGLARAHCATRPVHPRCTPRRPGRVGARQPAAPPLACCSTRRRPRAAGGPPPLARCAVHRPSARGPGCGAQHRRLQARPCPPPRRPAPPRLSRQRQAGRPGPRCGARGLCCPAPGAPRRRCAWRLPPLPPLQRLPPARDRCPGLACAAARCPQAACWRMCPWRPHRWTAGSNRYGVCGVGWGGGRWQGMPAQESIASNAAGSWGLHSWALNEAAAQGVALQAHEGAAQAGGQAPGPGRPAPAHA